MISTGCNLPSSTSSMQQRNRARTLLAHFGGAYQQAPRACHGQQTLDIWVLARVPAGSRTPLAQQCTSDQDAWTDKAAETYACVSSRCSAYSATPTWAACLEISPGRLGVKRQRVKFWDFHPLPLLFAPTHLQIVAVDIGKPSPTRSFRACSRLRLQGQKAIRDQKHSDVFRQNGSTLTTTLLYSSS